MNFTRWHKIWSKRYSIRLAESWCYGSLQFRGLYGTPFPKQRIEIVDSFGTGWVDEREYKTLLDHLVARIEQEGLEHVIGNVEQRYQQFLSFCKTLTNKELSKLSLTELHATLTDFLKEEDDWMRSMWPVFVLDEGLTPKLDALLAQQGKAEKDNILQLVLTPERKTAAAKFQEDILKLIASNTTGQELENQITALARTYAYFPILNMDEDELSTKEVETTYKVLAEKIRNPAEFLSDEEKKQTEINERFLEFVSKLPTHEANLFHAVRYIGFLREYRNDIRQEAYLHARELYREIAKRVSIELRDIIYCTRAELIEFLSEKNDLPSKETLNKRHAYSMILCDGAKTISYQWTRGSAPTEEGEDVAATEIKGVTAYAGFVKGTAKVILNVEQDSSKFNDGDILISTTTNLAFVPLMGKAKAIVTDEGGLLTHAAIVARELGIPCIIGTKNATQVLKDGDIIELDANNGIVRILSNEQIVFNPDDYILSFWVQGVSVFITDIHLEAYRELEVLYIIDNSTLKQYFTKKAYEQALERGLNFYSNKSSFDNYRKDLSNHCEKFKEFFETEIKNKESLSKESIEKFFEYTKKLCGDYAKMNFEFTDRAFSHQEENPIIKKNLSGVAQFKDTIRAMLNMVLFEPDGYSNQFFTILGKQFNAQPTLFDNLTQKEILRLFDGNKPNEEIVSKRQEAFIESYNIDGFYEAKEADTILQKFKEKTIYSDVIQGQIASKGRVSGIVKIIPVDYSNLDRVNAEIKKMRQGDILVAETTAPELIVACKKAAAIITDMGGLMSHAAIVSREFKIPCIVGTKNASKILKDGDIVEVDAERGIVKRLSTHTRNPEQSRGTDRGVVRKV